MVYGIDVKLPGHAQRRDQGLPGVRRQAQELRRRQGRRACRASRRSCRSATPPSPSSPTPGGTPRPRSTRCRSSGTRARTPRSRAPTIAEWLKEGLDAEQAFVGNKNGDAKAALAGAAKKVEAVYAYPYQNHATHGADERDRALHAGQVRGVVPARRTARRRSPRRVAGVRPAGRQVRRLQASCSAAASAGAARSDYVTQAVLIAKQMPGTPVKLIWSREEDMTHGALSSDHAVQADRRASTPTTT